MNLNEIIEKKLSERFINDNKSIIDGIISYVQNCKDELIIKTDGFELREISNILKSNNKEYDTSINLINNGIHTKYLFKYLWDRIKNNVSKSITKLTLPLNEIDIKDLALFPNVNTLISSGFNSLNEEELKYVGENTNIKNIYVDYLPYKYDGLTDYFTINDTVMFYKDIVINRKNNKKIDNKIEIKCSELNNRILDIVSSKYNFDSLSIHDSHYSKYSIEINDNKKYNITIMSKDLNKANDLYNYFVSKGYDIENVNISIIYRDGELFNKKKMNYSDYDYSTLDELSKKVNINVNYDSITKGSYEEFKGLVESVKWYRNIIKDYPLSPLERLAFAYDIMKTFKYNESKNDAFDSRRPHRIIETGNIVCVGYTALLNEIMEGIDPNIKTGEFSCTCYQDDDKTLLGYHSRGMVRIDDDKYNVHGMYAIDPTWDSFKDKGKEVLGDDYDALSLYHYFLIPFKEYGSVFEHDTKPQFFKGTIEELNSELTSEKINEKVSEIKKIESSAVEGGLPQDLDENKLFEYSIGNILDDVRDVKDKIKSFDSKRLKFEEFLSLVRNVRMAEGYSGEYLDQEMKKIERINAKYYGREVVSEFVKQ